MALVNERVQVLSNEKVGPGLFVMKVSSPLIASSIEPGQFVHMKIPGMNDHILRRPFSIYSRNVDAGTMDILYQVVGYGTDHMTEVEKGAFAELIGPVGTPWNAPRDTKHALLVCGGVGAAPLFMMCEQLVSAGVRVDVVLGAQTESALVCRSRYEQLLGRNPLCATDDGSYGREGFCTSLVDEALEQSRTNGDAYDYLAVCGPEPLMRIVSQKAIEAGVPAQLSMEKRMACGVGACLSCVVDTVDGKRRACVDGPVFDAEKVVWE